jgi:hypothetical protein
MTTPNTQTQYARLLASLEDCRWTHMRILADAAEEEGNATLAAGWRWLADNTKWPRKNTTGRNYPDTHYEWESTLNVYSGSVEYAICHSLFCLLRGCKGIYYRSPNSSTLRCKTRLALLQLTAQAAGEWLARQKEAR